MAPTLPLGLTGAPWMTVISTAIALVALVLAAMALRTVRSVKHRIHTLAERNQGWSRAASGVPEGRAYEFQDRVKALERRSEVIEGQLTRALRTATQTPPTPQLDLVASTSPAAGPAAAAESRSTTSDADDMGARRAISEPASAVVHPVDLEGDFLVPSRALVAVGVLHIMADHSGEARLFLNTDVELDHVAFERWSTIFDLRGGGPYMCYRTVEPTVVSWNAAAQRGSVIRRGIAEVVA